MDDSSPLSGRLKDIHDALDEGEREVFMKALRSPSVTAERLSWSLEQMGHQASASLIRTYRRRLRAERAFDDLR